MATDLLSSQASEVASLLPRIVRRLFVFGADDPGIELPVAQVRICAILSGGPHPMSALSRELGISLSAVTQIADRMERSGLVERVPEADDRRVRCLRLTSRGAEMVNLRRDRRALRILEALRRLAPESRTELIRALDELLTASTETAPNGGTEGAFGLTGDLDS